MIKNVHYIVAGTSALLVGMYLFGQLPAVSKGETIMALGLFFYSLAAALEKP